jgi:hypothetical protein
MQVLDCSTCQHDHVCQYKEDFEEAFDECEDIRSEISAPFTVDLICQQHLDKRTPALR